MTGTRERSTQEVERLRRRLEREQYARREAERISERATRELYDRQVALQLLEAVVTACNEAASTDGALRVALDRVCAHAGWPVGHAYVLDRAAGDLVPTSIWHLADGGQLAPFREVTERMRFSPGVGMPGRVLAAKRAAWIVDVTEDDNFPRAEVAEKAGLKAAFAFPVTSEHECVAVLEFFAHEAREPDDAFLELMGHVGLQIGHMVERKWTAQELARVNRRTEALLDSAGEGIYGVDPDGLTTFVNPAAARMLDWEPQELVGRRIHDVVHASPTSAARHPGERCPLHPSTHELGDRQPVADVFHRRDGTSFPVECIATSIRDGDLVAGGVVTFMDVTERKRFESQLERTRAELERSNAALEQFAYAASHDLGEPLRAIAGFTKLLGERYGDRLDERGESYVHHIVQGVRRMEALIGGLLEYSRVGSAGLRRVPVRCDDLLSEVLTGLSDNIERTSAEVTADRLPTVWADPLLLAQVFQNLISNAIKFGSADGPLVHISAERTDRGWQFSVRDNGIGIEPRHAERIFKIFQRLHGRESYEGAGIGLALCKAIVERHGGDIRVEQAPEGGSIFTFTVPIGEEAHDADGHTDSDPPRGGQPKRRGADPAGAARVQGRQ